MNEKWPKKEGGGWGRGGGFGHAHQLMECVYFHQPVSSSSSSLSSSDPRLLSRSFRCDLTAVVVHRRSPEKKTR